MKKLLLWLSAMITGFIFLPGCQKEQVSQNQDAASQVAAKTKAASEQADKANTFYGPQSQIGNGKVRTWIRISHTGVPEEIGIEMSAGSLTGLPAEDHVSLALPLHQKAMDMTPFQHLYFNWNPHGHEPTDFFGVPHFDFHFYMTSSAEREAIPAWSPSSDALFNHYPPPGYLPADYSTGPGPVATEIAMGKHWLPPPPTFLPFSKVMIYGTYDGHVTFIEPMITLAYLNSGASVSQPYSQPALFEHTGKYYPTVMNISMDEKTGNHYVSLGGFVQR